jgi:hypothetical protein
MPEALASAQSAGAIAVDAMSVYWADSGKVMKMPISGGTPIVLVTSGAGDLAIDGTNVYWLTASEVMSVPKTGGTPTMLAGGQARPSASRCTEQTSIGRTTSASWPAP